jgi:hypothetical protein
MATNQDPLAALFQVGAAFLAEAMPEWTFPNTLPPGAVPFDNNLEMLDQLWEGDHIAVLNPSGYWHHGIYVGKVSPARSSLPPSSSPLPPPSLVVEVWGENKESSKITARPFATFVAGGTRFACIRYAEGSALPCKWTAALALHLLDTAGSAGFYNVAFNNCEHFATLCRTLRCEQAQAQVAHAMVAQCLQQLPAQEPPKPYVRGFK